MGSMFSRPKKEQRKLRLELEQQRESLEKKERAQSEILAAKQRARFQRQTPKTLFSGVLGIDEAISNKTTLGV